MEWKQFFFTHSLYIPTGPSWTDPDDTPSWFWDSISDAISSAIDGLLSAIAAPFNLIGNALDYIGEGIENLGNRIWNFFSEPLGDIWEAIVTLPSDLVNGIREMLTTLFVPSENYFSEKFTYISNKFNDKIGIDITELETLKDVEEIDLNGISELEGTIYGQRVKFVDLSFLKSIKYRIHNLARGFMFPLLLLYNLNQVYFLVRGVNLFGIGKGGKND